MAESACVGGQAADSVCYVKKGESVARRIAGETILVPVRGGIGDLDYIYNLNDVASHIWNGIDGDTTVQQLVESIGVEFDVSIDVAERDALQFIADLQKAGLIEPRPETEE